MKCKVNIVQEMVHVSVELDFPAQQSAARSFFLCENSSMSKSWGDAFLKAVAVCKSMVLSKSEVGSIKDDIDGNMFLEHDACGVLNRGQETNRETMIYAVLPLMFGQQAATTGQMEGWKGP